MLEYKIGGSLENYWYAVIICHLIKILHAQNFLHFVHWLFGKRLLLGWFFSSRVAWVIFNHLIFKTLCEYKLVYISLWKITTKFEWIFEIFYNNRCQRNFLRPNIFRELMNIIKSPQKLPLFIAHTQKKYHIVERAVYSIFKSRMWARINSCFFFFVNTQYRIHLFYGHIFIESVSKSPSNIPNYITHLFYLKLLVLSVLKWVFFIIL